MFHHTTLTADDPHERTGTRCHPPPKLSQHIEHFVPGRSSSRVRFLTLIALPRLRLLYILKRAPGAGTAGSSGPGQLVEDATSSLVQNPHTKVLTINFAGGFNTTVEQFGASSRGRFFVFDNKKGVRNQEIWFLDRTR